jgi:hypothetical protein
MFPSSVRSIAEDRPHLREALAYGSRSEPLISQARESCSRDFSGEQPLNLGRHTIDH